MIAIILAAGVGSRLGMQLPKCLTVLPNKKTILRNQIDVLRANNVRTILIVVGFKKEIIMEEYPELLFLYNPVFHLTNTSKSLLRAMESIDEDDILWINGDVYLEQQVVEHVIKTPGNAVAVDKSECGEEEIKYRTNEKNHIIEISKKVVNAEGEGVGVNKVCKKDFRVFMDGLRECANNDYFEKGIEISIQKGVVFVPVDISSYQCIEIDFHNDLERVEKIF